MLEEFLKDELGTMEALGLKRSMKLVEGAQGPTVVVDGKRVLLLCSNDYLGLAAHPEVRRAAIEAVERYGFGAGASRLVSGNMQAHALLEERVRTFKGAEAALLFNSGYNANIGVITALGGRDAEIFSDRLNHASIVDACLLSRSKVTRYLPCDAASLERALKKSRAKRKLIVTEGIFSMDGTVAPLKEIIELAGRYGAVVYLDDAHAAGVAGENGRGTLEMLGLGDGADVVEMGTLGKAFGSFGAYVTGPKKLMELLVSRARSFIYTTALPPAVCMAAAKGVEIASGDEGARLRASLRENAACLREGLKRAGFDTMGSSTQIIPVFVGEAGRAMEISGRLLDNGVYIQGIRPPTVPAGTSRLRITVSAGHSADELCAAVKAVRDAFDGAAATEGSNG